MVRGGKLSSRVLREGIDPPTSIEENRQLDGEVLKLRMLDLIESPSIGNKLPWQLVEHHKSFRIRATFFIYYFLILYFSYVIVCLLHQSNKMNHL